MTAALPAGQLVDVPIRRAKVAPPAAALVHLPPKELHAGCLQLPHGGSQIVDHEADDRTGGEVHVVPVAWTKHLERAALWQLEGGKVRPFLAGRQPEDRLKECHHRRVLACPGACPANALDPHPLPSPAQALCAPRSCHITVLEKDRIGRPGTARPMQTSTNRSPAPKPDRPRRSPAEV